MKKILIIGAGMAGLTAARGLSLKGHQVVVLDKGRGLGGRMATRRMGAARIDHGAQYFSAKTAGFQQLVQEAQQAGVLHAWNPAHLKDAHARWVGTDGMTALPKYLAKNLTVHHGQRAVCLSAKKEGWEIATEQGQTYGADVVIVTIPAPQALELLAKSELQLPSTEAVLQDISYHPCLAVLALLDRPSGLPGQGSLCSESRPIAWMVDNLRKCISAQPSLTIHASPAFSRRHIDGDRDAAAEELLHLAKPKIAPAKVTEWQLHCWRYSLAYKRHVHPFHRADAPHPLLFGGDGFGIGNVEGAFISGMEMSFF